LKNTQEGKV